MNKEIEDKVKELSRRIVGTGQIVVTAESLTGGMISAALTSIPGASEWFERGFVTYTNQAKHEMLDVPQSILDRFSAVSTQTVSQMLEGAIRHSNATMAVAVSGIAGPDGAMPACRQAMLPHMPRDTWADPSVLCLSAGSAKMKWPKSAAMNSRATVRACASRRLPLPSKG